MREHFLRVLIIFSVAIATSCGGDDLSSNNGGTPTPDAGNDVALDVSNNGVEPDSGESDMGADVDPGPKCDASDPMVTRTVMVSSTAATIANVMRIQRKAIRTTIPLVTRVIIASMLPT